MAAITVRVVFALVICFPSAAAAQRSEVPADATIQLQRTSCLGFCPIYTVTIDARGTVTYNGDMYVRVVGRHTARIAPGLVATLLASAGRIHFFDLRDVYRTIEHPGGTVTGGEDSPGTIVTVTVNGRTTRVEDYFGAPAGLAVFEREIEEAAHTIRWVFIDEESLNTLLRTGWLASSEEGATLLQQAVERDDLAIARTLIKRGARLHGRPVHGAPGSQSPTLVAARSGAMVNLLVKAGADPNEAPVEITDWTPLISAAYKDADFADALVKAGARLEQLDADGRSALWNAACAGNWRVVTVLLRAGANPRGSADEPALECTRRVREDYMHLPRAVLDEGQPTIDDFDRVIALLEAAGKQTNR